MRIAHDGAAGRASQKNTDTLRSCFNGRRYILISKSLGVYSLLRVRAFLYSFSLLLLLLPQAPFSLIYLKVLLRAMLTSRELKIRFIQ